MSDDIGDVEQRLARLEAAVSRITAQLRIDKSEAAPPQPRSTAAPDELAILPPVLPRAPRREPMRAEDFLGGRVLLAAGALTLILGVSFFINYAFDNGWIGPAGRVAIGLLAGIAFVAVSQRFRHRTRTIFADALTGIGGAILYLSLWGAGSAFHLVPLVVSFGAMMVVTASLIVLALRSESQVLIVFALLGGFLTPALNASPAPAILPLFVYLSILNGTLLFAPRQRRWPIVAPTAFVFTQIYVLSVYSVSDSGPLITVFSVVFFALFVARPVSNALGRRPYVADEALVVFAATSALYATLHGQYFGLHHYWLTATVVVLAAGFVVLAQRTEERWRATFAAIGLALITGGVAVTFTGDVVTVLWIVEAAALMWVGIRQQMPLVRFFGYAGFVLAGCAVLIDPPSPGFAFANEQFVTYLAFAIGFFIVSFAATRFGSQLSALEQSVLTLSEPLGHLATIAAFSLELDRLSSHNELAVTLFWILYAAALMTYGFLRGRAFSRWESFVLLTIAVIKAFAVDLAAVNPGIRIVSFLALGSMMLGFSYVYQRATKRSPLQ